MAEIRVNSTGAVKLFDNDDSHFVGLQAGSVSSNVTFTLPTADGSNGQFLKTDGSGALSFGSVSSALDDITTGDAASTLATSAGNITIDAQGNDTDIIFKGTDGSSDTTFLTIDGSDAGTLIANHNLELGTDASEILFGADNEVKVIHNADKGLILKHTATADDKPVILTLQTGETDMAANDVIGKIEFQAPDESTGTDAILVSGAIQAVAEGDHSSSSNATRLEFMTGASEAATSQMTISSGGIVGIGAGVPGDLGVGLHIKSADSGASVDGNADELVVEGSGQSGITICSANDNKGNIFFADDGSTAQGKVIYDHSDNHLRFDTAGSERMRIKSDGNVGIGETNPSLAKLQINQATSGTLNQICLRQDNNGGGDKQVIRFVRDTDESGSGAEVSAIIAEREGGNDTALVFKTDTAGGGSTTEHFRINAGGDLTATDTSIGSNSDQRLKENVADYSYDIDKFKTYKVKSFDWKNPARHRNKTGQIGFIAQDVESIDTRWLGNVILSDENDPDYSLISADGDGNRVAKTLKLGENDAMYISIIQQSITKIETLETEMTALKARVTTLEG